jgi:hypothetical protein
MSITTGNIPGTVTWTEKCDQLRTILESISGVTLYSDTGTGDYRILLYTLPALGTNHLLKISRTTTYGYFYILKLDGASNLLSYTGMKYTDDWTYIIVTNGNLTGVVLRMTAATAVPILWTNCGTITKVFFNTAFIHPTLDAYASLNTPSAYPPSPTVSGKQILVPAFCWGDSISTNLAELPLENVYCFNNADALAGFAQVTINSVIYMIWPLDTFTTLKHIIKTA